MINNLKEIIRNRNEVDKTGAGAGLGTGLGTGLGMNNVSSRETSSSSSEMNKSQAKIMNKFDQEIIQNYKVKLLDLETENHKVTEQLHSLMRNFEALCLKNKEDTVLIKKLEQEISFLKNKIKSMELNLNSSISNNIEEKEVIIKGYKDKIDQLNSIIKNLENKINNSGANAVKFQEKESFYRNYINKIDEKNKNLGSENENLMKENKKMKKELDLLKKSQREKELSDMKEEQEVYQLKEKIISLESQIGSLEGKLRESTDLANKLKKEKELIEKLLMGGREKIKNLDRSNKEKIQIISEKDAIINENMMKINKSNEELNNKIQENELLLQKIENLHKNILDEKMKIVNSSHKREHDIFSFELSFIKENRKINKEDFRQILWYKEENNKILANLTSTFEGKILSLENKLKNSANIINGKINNILNTKKRLKSEISLDKNIISQLESEIKTLSFEKDSTKLEIYESEKKAKNLKDTLEKKINKKRNKIYTLKLENAKLQKEIEHLNQILRNKEDKIQTENEGAEKLNPDLSTNDKEKDNPVTKLDSFYTQIANLSSKLKLTLDTLYLTLTCRVCGEDRYRLFILQCGHSLCEGCIKSNKNCTDCKNSSLIIPNFSNTIENITLNNLVSRFKFANQISHDIQSIVNYIKSNFA